MEVFFQPVVVLPITLNNFKASLNSGKVQLNWSLTSQEAGTSVLVQRSVNGLDWSTLHQLQAVAASEQAYSYTDRPQQAGSYVYRLQIVSPTGRIQYSKEAPIEWSPAGNTTALLQKGNTLFIQKPADNQSIRLFNSSGQPVQAAIQLSVQNAMVDISHLPAGIYMIQVNEQVHKFLKR